MKYQFSFFVSCFRDKIKEKPEAEHNEETIDYGKNGCRI